MKKEIYLPVDNLYVRSLLDIFNDYLIKECTAPYDYLNNLVEKIKMSQALHYKERQAVVEKTRLGDNSKDGSNTEIVFINGNGDEINRINTLKNYV